jgi:hypothetical protein
VGNVIDANIGWDQMNPGIRFSLYQVPAAFSEGGGAGRGKGNFFVLRMGNCP